MLNSCWVLEFLLRQPIRNHLLHNIFLLLPFPSPPPTLPLRLLKTLLLRRIVSRPISDQTLLSLELIHRQNLTSNVYNAFPLLLPLIQSAYLHAAVGSTLEPLRTGDLPDFFDAVTRVWTMRVGDLEASEDNGLVSEGLLEWKRKMEAAAAGSREARDEVLEGWRVEEGMAAVREYLVKELEVMGPTVLEMAAEAQLQGRNAGEVLGDVLNGDGDVVNGDGAEGSGGHVERGEVGVSSNSKGIDNGDCVVIEQGGEGEERNEGIVEQLEVGISSKGIDSGDCVVMEGGDGEASDGSRRGEERNGEQVERGDVDISFKGEERTGEQVERGEVDASLRGEERTGEQVERGEVDMGLRGVDTATLSVPTPEINKVKENLRRSREDLRNVVEDPLPNAKKAASRVIARKSVEVSHLEEPVENHSLEPEGNQNKVDVSEPPHAADKGSEVIHTGSTNTDIEVNKDLKRVSGRSLMDRNPTARSHEWEDESLQSASDNASSPSKKLHLPSPRTTRASPLKPVLEVKKVARKRKRWSVEEEDTLREAVNKYGKGNWKIMLNSYRDVFQERTEVDLKDKWRNMTKPS